MDDHRTKGTHVATIAFQGELWHVYLEAVDDPRRPDVFRGCLRFDAGSSGAGFSASPRTAVIIVENSYDSAVATARGFDEQTLSSMLGSSMETASSESDA